jgi:uncharacterized phage protein gp47/JayE
MAWTIRSLADISARTRGAFRQYMKGTDAALNTNFVTVVAKVLAGISHEFELRMAWLTKQLFLSTATGRFLALHASDIGIFRKGASSASGSITVTGTPNFTYSAGVRFLSGNITYVSTTPATASPLGIVTLLVKSDATGAHTNRDADGVLTLADPVLWPSLGQEATVGAAGLGGGADAENDDNLRARALHRKRNPRSGGRLTDYETVALAVPGVFKAWAFRRPLAPGYLAEFFLFEGRPNGIPTAGDVLVVQAAIDAERLIRIDDGVAIAPTPLPIDIEINGLSNDTDDVRAAINFNLASMYVEKCRPGIEGDTFTLSRSWISEAISQASGEDRHVLAWPLGDIVLTNGQFPVPGVVTYGA